MMHAERWELIPGAERADDFSETSARESKLSRTLRGPVPWRSRSRTPR